MRSSFCLVVSLLLAAPAAAQDMPLSQVLIPGEGWKRVAKGFEKPSALAADRAGHVYVADKEKKEIVRVDKDGGSSLFAKTGHGVTGMAFGPDGRLYTCQPKAERIMAYTPKGDEKPFVR